MLALTCPHGCLGSPPRFSSGHQRGRVERSRLANLKGRRGKKGLKEAIARELTKRGGVTSEGRKGERERWPSKQGSREVGGQEGQGGDLGDPALPREPSGRQRRVRERGHRRLGEELAGPGRRGGRRGGQGRRTPRLTHSTRGGGCLTPATAWPSLPPASNFAADGAPSPANLERSRSSLPPPGTLPNPQLHPP